MSIHAKVMHNGTIRPADEPFLRAGQVGLLSGWGIFTTLRVSKGVVFAWERHWNRLSRDAGLMRVPMEHDAAEVRRWLESLLEANGVSDCTLRLVIVRNTGGIWEGPNSRQTDVIALTSGLKEWGDSVRLAVEPQGRHAANRFAGEKILSWAANLNYYELAHERGFDEIILLNERDEVAECTSANIFAVRGGAVVTPPLSSGCLPGITREILLKEIHSPDLRIAEETLRLDDLYAADEVFITSTTRDVLAVREIQGKPVGRSGRVTAELNARFNAYIRDYVEQHQLSQAIR